LPLLVEAYVSETSADDVVAVLEHSSRIRQISLRVSHYLPISQNEKVWAAMQVPFPELTVLIRDSKSLSEAAPILPDLFLGGSVPHLQFLYFNSIPFPGFPNLLLSATHLVYLSLLNIPHSGYISPEAMATCLSVLTSLDELFLGFESPQSCPDQESRRPLPPTRSFLPALMYLEFKGAYEYLEELVARIDAPRCYLFSPTFFNDIHFDTPELIQFISRTPPFGACNKAHLVFHSHEALVRLQSQPGSRSRQIVEVKILCQVPDWQLSALAQICTSSLDLPTVEHLHLYENPYPQLDWKDNIENAEWLQFLLPFTAVKNLYLSKYFAPRIAPALQELTGGRTTEVLPTLQNLFLEGFLPSAPVQEGIGQFISARQLTNRPVAISVWERDHGSKTWESAVKRINWVMDMLSPIAEVRTILLSLTKLISAQLFPHAKMAHSLLSAIPKVRPFAPYSKQSAHAMFVWMIDTPATVST